MELSKLTEDFSNSSESMKSSSKKKILTEEEYTERMEEIITRDFFPDLPKLQAQNAYLDAVGRGDLSKMQELQTMYQLSESTRSRVSSLREPSYPLTPSQTPASSTYSLEAKKEQGKTKETLDQFLTKATSEDNASFERGMEKSKQLHEQKYPWLYKDEKAESRNLALPVSRTHEAVEELKEVATWAYKNKNALMYVPDGVELTQEEKLSAMAHQKEIMHLNSRFEMPPFDEEANREAIAEAASLQAKMREGRVGIDGKELLPSESPKINGFGFVATPLPQPGVSDTPIMTWGEIEGTPFRLDGGDTPLPQTPSSQQFRIPNISARERIALTLADKAAKKHRKQNKSSDFFSPSIKFGSSSPLTSLEKIQGMSPAAQNLAYAKLGLQKNTDRALRASYSPSPARTPDNKSTPLQTPNSTPSTRTATATLSNADPCVNLPKRHKASDFF